MSVTSDEVNYLVYRYLQESGFVHASYAFGNEAHISKSDFKKVKLAPGALVTYLQKGLLYTEAEKHLKEDGSERPCTTPFTLLDIHECERQTTKSRAKKAKRKEKEQNEETSTDLMVVDEPADDLPNEKSAELLPSKKGADAAGPSSNASFQRLAEPKRLLGHSAEVFQCALSPDKTMIATGSGDSTIALWTLADIRRAKEDTFAKYVSLVHGENLSTRITSIDWSADSQLLVSGALDGLGRLWSRDGKLLRTLKGHSGPVLGVRFNTDGKYVVSASVDGTCKVWNADDGSLHHTHTHHKGAAMEAAWRNTDTFASAGTDGKIIICSTKEAQPLRIILAHQSDTNQISWSPDRFLLASCSDDHTVKIWHVEEEQPLHILRDHTKEVYSTKWSLDGSYFATSSVDSTVKVYKMPEGDLMHNLTGHKGGVYAMDFAYGGSFLFTGCMGGTLCLWDIKTGNKLAHVRAEGSVYDLKWDENQQWLYVGLGRKEWGSALAYHCRLR